MERVRLLEIMARFADVTVLVLGDYFLDKYLDIDRSLSEASLETGLEAHQVVGVRTSPGGAGNVAANLSALGVRVVALSIIGDDGQGYELLRELRNRAVDTSPLLQSAARVTPTYFKPMMHEHDGRIHELSRLDIKNHSCTPDTLQDELITRLHAWLPKVDGVIIADQVPERNCGIVSDRVRQALAELAREHPQKVFVADSRMRLGEYEWVILKPNEMEALRAVGRESAGPIGQNEIESAGQDLCVRTQRPVFVTMGERGILVCEAYGCQVAPAVPVPGPIDIVGAGDSALAGIAAGLCSGASLAEAAVLGNLVASVTIQCIGTTGTASQDDLLKAVEYRQGA